MEAYVDNDIEGDREATQKAGNVHRLPLFYYRTM